MSSQQLKEASSSAAKAAKAAADAQGKLRASRSRSAASSREARREGARLSWNRRCAGAGTRRGFGQTTRAAAHQSDRRRALVSLFARSKCEI